jgi:hypothetical protein
MAFDVVALDQADGVTGNAESDEVVVRGDGLPNELKGRAGTLVEGFDGGDGGAVVLPVGFGEDAFGAGLVDIKPEDLAAELALDDDAVRADGWLFGLGRKAERKTAAETEQSPQEDDERSD